MTEKIKITLKIKIRNAEDAILVVKCLEYEYKIQFPKNIPKSKA